MPKQQKAVQTLDSLMAQTTEEGDCLLWDGVYQNNVPHARHNGQQDQTSPSVGISTHGKHVFRSDAMKPGPSPYPIEKSRLESLYVAQRLSQRSIAMRFGVDRMVIRRALTRYGIKRPS